MPDASPPRIPPLEGAVTRREAFRLAASALLATSLLGALAGCGGGGGGGSRRGYREAAGTLNAQELGGGGHRVATAYEESAVASGAFSVRMVEDAAQLVTAVDASGTPRGMAISLPGQPTAIDAASTAAALAFLSPGVATSVPAEATERLAAIAAHASFAPLADRVRAVVPASGLAGLRSDAVAQSRLAEILDALEAPFRSRSQSPSVPSIGFSAAWGKGPGTVQQVDFEHNAYRFVRLDEAKLDKDRNRMGTLTAVKDASGKPILSMPGTTMVSLGSILSGTLGSPSKATGQTNLLQPPGSTRYKVYVSGPGTGLVGEQAERGLAWADVKEPWGMTFTMLALLPVLDVVLGAVGVTRWAAAKLVSSVGNIYGAIQAKLAGSSLFDAASGGDTAGLMSALVDAVVSILALGAGLFPVIVMAGAAAGITVAGAGAAAIVGLALGVVAAGMSATNMALAARKILRYPSVESVELPMAGAEVIVK